eukprot:2932155-Rhodomonas_salina.2
MGSPGLRQRGSSIVLYCIEATLHTVTPLLCFCFLSKPGEMLFILACPGPYAISLRPSSAAPAHDPGCRVPGTRVGIPTRGTSRLELRKSSGGMHSRRFAVPPTVTLPRPA